MFWDASRREFSAPVSVSEVSFNFQAVIPNFIESIILAKFRSVNVFLSCF